MKTVVRYSDAFKLQVVKQIEQGRFQNCNQATRRYGIRGQDTVARWIRRYGKNHLLGKVVRVQTTKERDELKAMKVRVRQLERLVSDKELELKAERIYTMFACRTAGIEDVAEFKKKADMTLLTR